MMLNHGTQYAAPQMIYNRRNFTQETGKTVLTNGATSH